MKLSSFFKSFFKFFFQIHFPAFSQHSKQKKQHKTWMEPSSSVDIVVAPDEVMTVIENHKENVQPLRGGRSAASLAANQQMNDKDKGLFDKRTEEQRKYLFLVYCLPMKKSLIFDWSPNMRCLYDGNYCVVLCCDVLVMLWCCDVMWCDVMWCDDNISYCLLYIVYCFLFLVYWILHCVVTPSISFFLFWCVLFCFVLFCFVLFFKFHCVPVFMRPHCIL